MKKLIIFFILVLLAFIFSSCVSMNFNVNTSDYEEENDLACDDCLIAIGLAERELEELDLDDEEYRLIRVENLVQNEKGDRDPDLWLLTYKLENLIPHEPGEIIGAGGEIFIKVNVETEEVEVTGFGE